MHYDSWSSIRVLYNVEDVGKAMRAEWYLRATSFLGGMSEHIPTWLSSTRSYRLSAAANAIESAISLLTFGPQVVHLHPDQALYPGFADAHAHVIENGFMLELPLVDTQSLEDVVAALESYVLTHPDVQKDKDRWIEGMGWDQTKWNEGTGAEFPTAVSSAVNLTRNDAYPMAGGLGQIAHPHRATYLSQPHRWTREMGFISRSGNHGGEWCSPAALQRRRG